MVKKKIKRTKKASPKREKSLNSYGLYVCIIVDLNGIKTKQTFITRYSPSPSQLREDVQKQIDAYNLITDNKCTFEGVTCYAHNELKLKFPFIEDGYSDLKGFVEKSYGTDWVRSWDEYWSKIKPINKVKL